MTTTEEHVTRSIGKTDWHPTSWSQYPASQQATYPDQAALELLHTAFLVHDDIEDDSEIRRGEPSLHRRYGLGPARADVFPAGLATLIALMERFTYLAVNRDLGDRDTVVETAATVSIALILAGLFIGGRPETER